MIEAAKLRILINKFCFNHHLMRTSQKITSVSKTKWNVRNLAAGR